MGHRCINMIDIHYNTKYKSDMHFGILHKCAVICSWCKYNVNNNANLSSEITCNQFGVDATRSGLFNSLVYDVMVNNNNTLCDTIILNIDEFEDLFNTNVIINTGVCI